LPWTGRHGIPCGHYGIGPLTLLVGDRRAIRAVNPSAAGN